MSILLNNNILKAAEKEVERRLTPDTRDAYMRIVVAGMQAALADGPAGIMASLRTSKDPLSDAAKGAINLVLLLKQHSRGTMPAKAIPPAAMTLMLQALDFADKIGIVRVGADELTKATHAFTNYLFQKFNITPQMLHNAAANVHKVMQDPTAMEKINRKAGTVRAPGVSTPTEMGVDDGV